MKAIIKSFKNPPLKLKQLHLNGFKELKKQNESFKNIQLPSLKNLILMNQGKCNEKCLENFLNMFPNVEELHLSYSELNAFKIENKNLKRLWIHTKILKNEIQLIINIFSLNLQHFVLGWENMKAYWKKENGRIFYTFCLPLSSQLEIKHSHT